MNELSKAREKRIYGLDLLRLISMLMICSIHVLGELCDLQEGSVAYFERSFLLALFNCAVNCFAILSGYVGVTSDYKISKILHLWLTVAFYSVVITVICSACLGTFSPEVLLKAFLPVISERYWYFSAYFLMFFFIPLANYFCRLADKRQVAFFYIGLALISVVGIRLNAFQMLWSVNSGYSAFWLLLMYCLGGLMRLDTWKISKKASLLLCGASVLVTWGSEILRYTGLLPTSLMLKNMLYGYISPTMILSAVAMVNFFAKLSIGPRSCAVIRRLSPLAFSVYIIHYHKELWALLEQYVRFDGRFFLMDAMVVVWVIYALCLIMDGGRYWLFGKIGIGKLCQVADRLFEKLCEKFPDRNGK